MGGDSGERLIRLPRAPPPPTPPGVCDQPRRHALLVLEQRLQYVHGLNPLMVHPARDGLRRLQEPSRPVGEFFEVHIRPRISNRRKLVPPSCKTSVN
jgi:hypothetical protein